MNALANRTFVTLACITTTMLTSGMLPKQTTAIATNTGTAELSGIASYSADAVNLGNIAHYNGIIFSDATTYTADTEGALAIGGKASFGVSGGYDIGGSGGSIAGGNNVFMGKYNNPNGYPTLLIGGTVNENSGRCGIYAGNVVLPYSYKETFLQSGYSFDLNSGSSMKYADDSAITSFFASAYNTITRSMDIYTRGNDAALTVDEFKQFNTQNVTDFEAKNLSVDDVLVINVVSGGSASFGSISFPSDIDNYSAVIINLDASSVTFSGGSISVGGKMLNTSAPIASGEANALVSKYSSKLVWNLYNATSVTIEGYGIVGSVLAPKAAITANGGSINGLLVSNSLSQNGGMELHAFTLAKGNGLFNVEEPDTETPGTEEPGTETPGTEEPGTETPGTEEPGTETPGTEEPGTETPGTEEPGTETPGTEEPGTETPATEEPGTETPATEEPGTETPATEEPGTETPATEEPGTETPATEEPGTETPATEEPGTETPGTEEPGTEEPGTETPGTEKPATEMPGTEKPATETPGTEKPATETPGTEKPATETPGTEKPATEKPAPSKKPVVTPTPKPSPSVTPKPTTTPVPVVTPKPTTTPTSQPTTDKPAPAPTASLTPTPTVVPSPAPVETPKPTDPLHNLDDDDVPAGQTEFKGDDTKTNPKTSGNQTTHFIYVILWLITAIFLLAVFLKKRAL